MCFTIWVAHFSSVLHFVATFIVHCFYIVLLCFLLNNFLLSYSSLSIVQTSIVGSTEYLLFFGQNKFCLHANNFIQSLHFVFGIFGMIWVLRGRGGGGTIINLFLIFGTLVPIVETWQTNFVTVTYQVDNTFIVLNYFKLHKLNKQMGSVFFYNLVGINMYSLQAVINGYSFNKLINKWTDVLSSGWE